MSRVRSDDEGGATRSLPREAWVTAVASLSAVGPVGLERFCALDDLGSAWSSICEGHAVARSLGGPVGAGHEQRVAQLAREARGIDPGALWSAHIEAGIGVTVVGSQAHPRPFCEEPRPAPVVFHLGDPGRIEGPRVAIVGTRDCTRYGYDIAFELGRDLAASGVRVVSGLALGIDGAAHSGALEARGAPPVAVVGSGLDVVYPYRHRALWGQVARSGVIFSEYPLGTRPAAWRFPARNRLIAALADIVVVVESHERGGALLTVEEALVRGRDVMAVPGPVRSEASRGTNKMLSDGLGVVCSADDVLDALGLVSCAGARGSEQRASPEGSALAVLEAFGWRPADIEILNRATGIPLGELGVVLDELEDQGWIAARGGWYERVAGGAGG